MSLGKSIIFIVMVCSCAACATNRPLPHDARVIEVPFFKQEAYQCGPSALATAVNYWYGKTGEGKSLALDDIINAIYSNTARGTLTVDLELYAEKLGFSVRQFSGSLNDLRAAIDKGVPPLILVDYGFSLYEAHHFMVVTGYTEKGIILNTGREQNKIVANEELFRIWEKTGNWTLVIKPSGL